MLDSTVHNTQWITGHFHLIFAGTVVIMYFAIAYELWPHLTGHPLRSAKLACLQLWLWFVGMLLVTLPWHVVGLMGQPRRMAAFKPVLSKDDVTAIRDYLIKRANEDKAAAK